MNARPFFLSAASAGILLASCGETSSPNAGGGDEMGNFLRVSLSTTEGAPVAGARVWARSLDEPLMPESAPAPPPREGISGPDGRILLAQLTPGRWLVTARGKGIGRVDTVTVVDSSTRIAMSLALDRLGSLRGIVEPKPGQNSSVIRLPGRGLALRTDSLGAFQVDSLEPGPVILVAGNPKETSLLRQGSIIPGQIQDFGALAIDWSDWSWSRNIFLNTGASGISIRGGVTDLPIPLRLSRKDVDFSQLRPDFSDLRITTPDGRPMPMSVEWWNPSDSTLLVWTRLDSVHRDQDSQVLVVRGGNSRATKLWTNPFRSDAWQGVWHLGADLSDQTGSGRDARDFATFKSGGEVGECRWFKRDTVGHLEIADGTGLDPDPAGDVLVEAWARLDTRDPSGDDPILHRGSAGYRLQREGTSNFASFAIFDSAASSTAHPVFAKVTGTTNFADGAFHHLVGMRRGDSLLLFVDGKRDGQASFTGRTTSSNAPVWIGSNGSGRSWYGMIDEVRISRIARSDDWIRLSFEAQRKSGSPFLSR